MKRIFLIGKLNSDFEEIHSYFEHFFNIQVCVDNLELIQGILRLHQPDLILISMAGMDGTHANIFFELILNYPQIPVICVGTEEEQKCIGAILEMEPLHVLTRPVANEKILEKMNQLLKIEDGAEGRTEETKAEARKCVMLIDDNAIQIRVLNEVLKGKYDVQLATSGMKAMNLIGKRVPDIIFLDYDMPVCDGKLTFQMIRELEETKDVPIFFLTGMKDQEHIDAVMQLNPAGYLFKPATAEMLFSCIEQYAR